MNIWMPLVWTPNGTYYSSGDDARLHSKRSHIASVSTLYHTWLRTTSTVWATSKFGSRVHMTTCIWSDIRFLDGCSSMITFVWTDRLMRDGPWRCWIEIDSSTVIRHCCGNFATGANIKRGLVKLCWRWPEYSHLQRMSFPTGRTRSFSPKVSIVDWVRFSEGKTCFTAGECNCGI